jgi:hypothetical protein
MLGTLLRNIKISVTKITYVLEIGNGLRACAVNYASRSDMQRERARERMERARR